MDEIAAPVVSSDLPPQQPGRPIAPPDGPPSSGRRWARLRRLAETPALPVAVAAAAMGLTTAGLHQSSLLVVGALLLAAVLVRTLTSPRWAIGLVVVALPVGLSQQLSLGPVKLTQLVAAVAVGLVILHRMLTGQAPLRWHPSARWAVALAALVIVAAVTATDVIAAVQQAVTLAFAVLLALAVNATCTRSKDLRQVVLLLVVVGGGICLSTLGDAGAITAVADDPGAVDNRAVGIFQSPNQLGTFAGILLFVALGLAFGGRSRVQKAVGSVSALAAWAALLLSLSRGSWIGALLAFVGMLVFSRKARRVLPAALLATSVILGVGLAWQQPALWTVLQGRVVTLAQPNSDPEDARALVWQEARRQIAQHPLTGVGPGDYSVAAETTDTIHPVTPAVDLLHAHNVLLTVSAEEGIPAAAALILLTLSTARCVLRVRRRLPAPDGELLIGMSCGLVVLVGQGLVDYTLDNSTILMLTWMVLGLVFAASTPRSGGTAPARPGADGGY